MAQKRLRDRLAEGAPDQAETSDEEIEEEAGLEAEEEEEIEAEAPQEQEMGSLEDYKASLRWAVQKLSHPSEQWGLCDAHGRVPFTHQCAQYQNDEFAKAVLLAELETSDIT